MTTELTPKDLIMDQEVVYNNAIYTVKGLSENWVWLSGIHTRITVKYENEYWGGYLLKSVPEKWIQGKWYQEENGASFNKFTVTAVDESGNALIVWHTGAIDALEPADRKMFKEIS